MTRQQHNSFHASNTSEMHTNKFLYSILTARNAVDVDLRITPDSFVPSVEAESRFRLDKIAVMDKEFSRLQSQFAVRALIVEQIRSLN